MKSFDAEWMMVIARNYQRAEAADAEVRITTEVMLSHVEDILQHPELFS
jgi:hypothetical protein